MIDADYEGLVEEARALAADYPLYEASMLLERLADAVEFWRQEAADMTNIAASHARQLDSMTVEWGFALPGESGFETPDRATAESFVRDYPEEEYSLVQRLVGPWTVVPDATRLEDAADGSTVTGSDLNGTVVPEGEQSNDNE